VVVVYVEFHMLWMRCAGIYAATVIQWVINMLALGLYDERMARRLVSAVSTVVEEVIQYDG
jgi:hypothetical protein